MTWGGAGALLSLIEDPGVHSLYQPIVELGSGDTVAYEALARGPAGSPLASPAELFAAAHAHGVVARVDRACRRAAVRGALAGGLRAPHALFVNLEPGALDDAEGGVLAELAAEVDGRFHVVVEFTERALAGRPTQLLTAVEQVRRLGWSVALDDVGAERSSLALMPFLAPDVIKLDLRLVQQRTTVEVAEVVAAVNAEAERTGALVLAEGIETEAQEQLARSMGARLGQGWLFGRPAALPAGLTPAAAGRTSPLRPGPGRGAGSAPTPYAQAVRSRTPQRSTKPLLIAMSKLLERQALALGGPAVVIGAFQQARYFTPATARRYATLARSATFVAALAEGIPARPAGTVHGGAFPGSDPLAAEWDVVVVGPHFSGALLAHDLGDSGPEDERRFDYVVVYDRELVLAAGASLLSRVRSTEGEAPARPAATDRAAPVVPAAVLRSGAGSSGAGGGVPELLAHALSETVNGVTIADATRPDMPLVYVNPAFERMTGHPADTALGRNCRFLQGPGTDPEAVAAIAAMLRDGREVTTTLRNYRRDGTSWWNELRLSPVRGPGGALTHYVGIQHDVSDRVRAEEEARRLASHDSLTGLANRHQLLDRLRWEVTRAERSGTEVGVLLCDLDDFTTVNDRYGHAAGDTVLTEVAARMRAALGATTLLSRYGGDEFVAVLAGAPGTVAGAAAQAAADLRAALREPVRVDAGTRVSLGVSIGLATSAQLGEAPLGADAGLLRLADAAMDAQRSTAGGRRPLRAVDTTGAGGDAPG